MELKVSTQGETCPICSKTLSTKTNLINHQKTFHLKHCPYKCPYHNCSKAYSIASRLKVHMHTHTNEKPYRCTECDKSFCEKGYLKTHKKFHSTQRPFACAFCSKTYKTKGHLKDHLQVQHAGIKKYKCLICSKQFGRSSTLQSHHRTHTGEKKLKCPIDVCDHYFSEKGNMEIHYKRHLKRLHQVPPPYAEAPVTRACSNDTLFKGMEKNKENIFFVHRTSKKVRGHLLGSEAQERRLPLDAFTNEPYHQSSNKDIEDDDQFYQCSEGGSNSFLNSSL